MSSAFERSVQVDDDDDLYPSSDGEPLGETDWHIWSLILLREGLEDFFAPRPDVKIASDMFLYYAEGDPSASASPDTMVIKGVGNHFRRTFKTWIEKVVPSTIIEICSKKTWRQDIGAKRELYESLKIPEYFVFDPEAKYVKPPLRGFRLRRNSYQPLVPGPQGSVVSKELGLQLIPEGHMLRLIDVKTGQPVLTRQERVKQTEDRVKLNEVRVAELEAELVKLRGSPKRRGKQR